MAKIPEVDALQIFPISEEFILHISRRFEHSAPGWMDLDDLQQEARIGLLRGARADQGIIDALRRTHRVLCKPSRSNPDRFQGWELTRSDEDLEKLLDGRAANESPEELLLRKEAIEEGYKLLDQIPRKEVLIAYLWGDLAVSIAKGLGYSEGRISQWKKAALQELQKRMEEVE